MTSDSRSDAEQEEPIRYVMWCTASHGHQPTEHERGNFVLYADWDDMRNKYEALRRAPPTTSDVESAKVADLKRQLAAERDHGERLQKQLDAILRTDSSPQSGDPSE